MSTQSECSSLLSSITRIIDQSIEFPDEDDPFICSDGEWDSRSAGVLVRFPAEPVEEDGETPRLMPSPLRVRKSSAEIASVGEVLREQGQKVVARSHNQGKAGLPPPLPIKIVPAGEVRAGCSTPTGDDDLVVSKERKQEKIGQVEPSSSPLRESVMRYNGSIRFLRSQIGSSIADLQYLIDEVTEVQHMRRVSKTIRRSVSFWSFSPVKNQSCQKSPDRAFGVVGVGSGSGRVGEKETKEQRIARLRSEGWNTVGLKSGKRGWKGEEYYKAYCAGVLEEMYCI